MKFKKPKNLDMTGWHDAFVNSVVEGVTKKGNPVVKLRFEIKNADGSFMVAPKFGGVYNSRDMRAVYAATGTVYDEDAEEIFPEKDLLDKRLCIFLEVDEEWGSQVTDYKICDQPLGEVPF